MRSRPALVVFLFLGGCVFSKQGGMVFPARYDVGAVAPAPGGQPGWHVSGGLHWASLSPNPRTPVDVGIGYLVEQPGEDAADGAGDGAAARAGTALPHEPPSRLVHGPYLELARRIAGDTHRRSWVGARAELVFHDDPHRQGDSVAGVGLGARAAWELFATTRGRHSMGAGALGVFVEAGVRRFPHEPVEGTAVAGISFRLPLVVAK